MTQTTFNQRFKILIEFYKLRNVDVARKMKVDRQLITNYTNKSQPTIDKIALIAQTFPEVSLDWLVLGLGKMLKEGYISLVEEPVHSYKSIDNEVLLKLWEQDRIELARLRNLVDQLTNQLLNAVSNVTKSKTA